MVGAGRFQATERAGGYSICETTESLHCFWSVFQALLRADFLLATRPLCLCFILLWLACRANADTRRLSEPRLDLLSAKLMAGRGFRRTRLLNFIRTRNSQQIKSFFYNYSSSSCYCQSFIFSFTSKYLFLFIECIKILGQCKQIFC